MRCVLRCCGLHAAPELDDSTFTSLSFASALGREGSRDGVCPSGSKLTSSRDPPASVKHKRLSQSDKQTPAKLGL